MTWLLTIEARDPDNQPVTLQYSDGAYDAPDDTLYLPRMRQPGLYQSGLYAGEIVSVERSGIGETVLINSDGALDVLADYAVDGRAVVLSRTSESGVIEVLRGTATGLSWRRGEVALSLRAPQALLQRAHIHETYDGTNVLPAGLEGTADDIKGQVKPRVYGDVRNARPVLINTARLIYQISSRDDCEVAAVWDRGAPLERGDACASLDDLQLNEPPAGMYRCWRGFIRLGASPAGVVTVDAHTAESDISAVITAICAEAGQVCDVSHLAGVGAVGLYVTDAESTAALLDRLVVAGCYWRIDALGVLQAAPLSIPASPSVTLDDHEILSLDRRATGASSDGLPIWRVTVRADRIESTTDEASGVVDSARRARLSRQYREAVAERPAVLERHPMAGELVIDSCLRSLDDAQIEAERIIDLVSVRRDRVTLEGQMTAHVLDIGSGVSVRTHRLGYINARAFIVLGQQINARTGKATLELWG